MEPIHAVLFDYGLVLSGPPDPAAWAQIRTTTGLDEEALHRAYWVHRHDYDRGALTGPDYWQSVASTASLPSLTAEQLDALIAADTELWTQLNVPMVEWAHRLQDTGIRTGILSNIGDSIAEGIVAKFAWLERFHHRTWSHSLKTSKPDPAIYRHAAAGLETPPANILFIDDRHDNIEAAFDAGMQAIQYLNHDAFEREMQERDLAYLLHPARDHAIPRK